MLNVRIMGLVKLTEEDVEEARLPAVHTSSDDLGSDDDVVFGKSTSTSLMVKREAGALPSDNEGADDDEEEEEIPDPPVAFTKSPSTKERVPLQLQVNDVLGKGVMADTSPDVPGRNKRSRISYSDDKPTGKG